MSVQADIIGGSVEASYWYAGISGDATLGSKVDMEGDLGFEKESFFELAATVEHPVPVIPNVRLKYTSLDQSQDSTFTGTFGGKAFTDDIETSLDLSHVSLVLYYEILDNWVSVDVGLDVKKFDGLLELKDKSDGTVSNTDIDDFLPMAYASAEFAMPFTDMSFGAEVSALSYSDNSIYDAKVRLRQGFSLAFVELGYRQMGIKLDDVNNLDVDVRLNGVYLSTGLDF